MYVVDSVDRFVRFPLLTRIINPTGRNVVHSCIFNQLTSQRLLRVNLLVFLNTVLKNAIF